jgi:murein L,D-transpeptidase YafK
LALFSVVAYVGHRVRPVEIGIAAIRWLVVLVLAMAVGGCLTDDRALEPLPDQTKAELESKGLTLGAPLYVRIFKAESEMEVWLGRPAGDYVLFRTYAICNWSGDLGPKTREGDKQAPEGFYMVSARQMNPRSANYLAFNLGYPNAYDRAHGYTGSALMVHGGCRSVGCYAITDAAIQELFVLAREALAAGQREFPVHAFPFRMSEENMAIREGSRWYPFWQNMRQGYDIFEISHRPPVVGVKDQRYVIFLDNQFVPSEFRIQSAGATAEAGLIAGWIR